MRRVVVKSETLSAVSVLGATLRRANDNLDDADIARLVGGPFTPVMFDCDLPSCIAVVSARYGTNSPADGRTLRGAIARLLRLERFIQVGAIAFCPPVGGRSELF